MNVTIAQSTGATPSTFLSRLLQIALGLFVTTTDLPPYNSYGKDITPASYHCTFDIPCRWSSDRTTADHWLLARGEPDPFLWLASTGTMQRPAEPFALIELRGFQADRLLSDEIACQDDNSATLTFTYWITGGGALEVCLIDLMGQKFNCTAMLRTRTVPGKVLLSVPQVKEPFRIAIIPNIAIGIIAIDDINYDAKPCQRHISTTTSLPIEESEVTAENWIAMKAVTSEITESTETAPTSEIHSTEPPFDLLIIGNKTSPLFDRRKGRIISNNTMLLCDFTNNFPCLWGPESGRWGIIQEGAIPSLTVREGQSAPTYPAAIVIQGTAMLTSDPLKCQTGLGKLMFRHWTNGSPNLQVCAIGYGIGSKKIECVNSSQDEEVVNARNFLIFHLPDSILEPFTLNIIPRWDSTTRNKYLIIDEIAYIGSCNPEILNKEIFEKSVKEKTGGVLRNKPKSYGNFVWPIEQYKNRTVERKPDGLMPRNISGAVTHYPTWITLLPIITVDRTSSGKSVGSLNYCDVLDCDFEENSCNYLNHGFTKVPWILRTGGYGEPIPDSSNIPLSHGQFISAVLAPGQYAILESPRFEATPETNTLLFQYYRSSIDATTRLCVGNFEQFHKTSNFTKCPTVMESNLSKRIHKWNTARARLPSGTTYFFLIAYNSNESPNDTMVAIDNIRLASCNAKDDIAIATGNNFS